MKKEDYLKGLKAIENVAAEVERDTPAPKVEKPDKPAAAPAAQPPAAAPVPAAPAAAPAPVEPELFPGFATIAPEIQASIREKFRLAEESKAKADEATRVQREFMLSQQRLAPMQQQLSKAQTQTAELTRQLEQLRTAQATGNSADVKAKLDTMRENFPDDAALFEAAIQRAEAAEQRAAAIEGRFGTLEQRLQIESQLRELTDAHPDWRNKRIGVYDDPDTGTKVFRKSVDTPDATEMEVWANALDPYDRQIIQNCILSLNARDTIYALNRFEHDRAVAKVLAAQNTQGVTSPPEGSPAAPPATPTPAPDPDPQLRTTAPPRAAGQPVSEKKRALIEAAEFLRKQEAARLKRA